MKSFIYGAILALSLMFAVPAQAQVTPPPAHHSQVGCYGFYSCSTSQGRQSNAINTLMTEYYYNLWEAALYQEYHIVVRVWNTPSRCYQDIYVMRGHVDEVDSTGYPTLIVWSIVQTVWSQFNPEDGVPSCYGGAGGPM